MFELYGVDPASFEGNFQSWRNCVHPEDLAPVEARFRELVDHDQPFDTELRVVHEDGGIFRLRALGMVERDGDGNALRAIGANWDITERKRIELERERFMAAIEQAAESIVITDTKGLIQYVNPAFERITGYARDEAVGLNPSVLKSGEYDEAFYKAMWETLLRGETWRGRFVNLKKDGTPYTEEATISPVKDSLGKTVNYVAIKADITVALAREQQVRQSQKMESIGRLAGGVAHDFNNILQTITGFSGLLLAEMDAKSAQRQDVLEIQAAVKHAGALTRQLLAFSREQPTEYKVQDLNAVLSGAEKMLRQALDESVRLKLELASRLAPVNADATQLLQVAMNLTVNARDAMPEGGTVTLRTQRMEIEGTDISDRPASKVGKWVCFSVSDTGCGMNEKQLAHLFEPFFTTKRLGEGTGLGLSVVYGIVEEHGGWIHVDSDLGNGSTFQVFLPEHDAVESGGGDGLTDYDEFLEKRILFVEDDPVIQELTAEILQDVGYAVSVAADTREAKQLFSEKTEGFDMLFSDVVLPDGNG
ncbi:MAG: PAS domain S-box protein, partial [Verrucomicrobiota bacterium]|nr:PAS domain S-box protein [Verrucomicrobiota bacterium]